MPARPSVAGTFYLVLDGVTCGFLKSTDGGAAVAEVVSVPNGPTYFAKKHLGPLRYSPLAMQFGMSMTNDLYDWINASWSDSASRKSGAVIAADFRGVPVSQREFFNALITEVAFPKLDGSSKEPAYLTLRCAPEYTRTGKASGAVSPVVKNQKASLVSNFRLTIDRLDCTKVHSIDPFTVKRMVAADAIGDTRDFQKQPGRLEFPNLTITLAESSAQSWFDWFDDFVIKGNCDDSKEKKGSIACLAPNMADELLRIDLFNVGIFALAPDKPDASADTVATVTAQLYCERMELHIGAGAA
jgi:phage tail-like protein